METNISTKSPNLITRAAAADRAGVGLTTVDYWFRVGKIKKYKDGFGHVFVDADELDRLLTPVLVSGE